MTQSTSFAQMANNQSISLSSALRANTPPTKGQTTSRKFLTLSIFLLLSFFTTNAWGETVTYTVSSTSAVTTSGTAPDGSGAGYSSTYGTKCQLTKNNSMTLTLSGYNGCTITGLTLSMRSNSEGGAGNMSMKIGSAIVSSISTAKFNTSSWYGSWSTSYVNVTPSVTATTVGNGEEIVITIAATANSLYCQSFTLTYEPSSSGGDTSDACGWVETELDDVQSSDVIVITMTNSNGTTYAMSNNNGTSSAPAAVEVGVDGTSLTSEITDNIKWNVGGNNDAYTFYPNGDTSEWLYATSTNNGVRVGTNANKTFKIDAISGYLFHNGTSRYIGVYNSQDWRCYTTVHDNIKNQTLKFYKYVPCGPTTYTVTFNANGHGTAPQEQTITSGGKASEPTAPTATGYTFGGWYKEEGCTNAWNFAMDEVTENTNLYAKWTAIQTTITLNANGGSGNTTSVAATYDSSTLNPSSITNPTKTGHTFGGWYSGEGGTGSLVINSSGKLQANVSGFTGTNGVWKATTNKTLYAQWTIKSYTLTWNLNGGKVIEAGTHASVDATGSPSGYVNYNASVNVPEVAKDGHYFTGWTEDGTNVVTPLTKMAARDVTYIALWEEAGCPEYSFHTGGDNVKEINTQICFEPVGYNNEWQIVNYVIPADTKYFVGHHGYWYENNLGSNNSRSVVKTWSEAMYLAPAMDPSNPNGTPKIGQATGAVGTIRIFDNSNWDNLYVGFIPNGYKLKFSANEYDFVQHENTDYRSEIVEYDGSPTANYSVTVGITDADGNYVKTDHSQEDWRHIFVKDNVGWRNDGAKIGLYYWNNSTSGWCSEFLKSVPGETNLFEGWIPVAATKIKLVRYNSSKGNPGDWNDIWNQTGDISLVTTSNLFTISSWNDQTSGWSIYSSKGRFRIYNDSKSKNWYVHFYPHFVLKYNANGGEGTMEMQAVPKDASDKKVTIADCGFTRTGYNFVKWNKNASGTSTSYNPGATYTLSADVILYAQWEAQTYNITYKDQGNVAYSGSNAASLPNTHTYATATTLVDGVKMGYTFGGWYDNPECTGTAITQLGATDYTADITLYAKWTANTHTVTWKPAGGNWSGDANDIVQEYEYGTPIEAPEKPTYDCYEFVEWEPTYTADMTMPDEDLEFTAQWNKLSYTITFKNYDGTVLQTSTVECGETPSYTGATPTKAEDAQYTYTFKDWSPTIAPATKDQVYTAQFNQTTRSYTVTWYDGTGNAHKTQTADYNTTVALPTTNPDRCDNQYPHFIGWTADPINGSTTIQPELVENVKVTGDCDYYAVFAKGEGGSSNYQKVTSALDDWSGEYLIVYETGNVAFNGGLSTLDVASNTISVTISDNTIEGNSTTDAANFTIAAVSGGYTIKSASGYYIGRTANSNGLNTSPSTSYTNTISYSDDIVSIKGSDNGASTILKYNSSNNQNRFRYYTSGQHPIQLYKKGSGVNYTAFITTCCTSWTAPTLTYPTELEENGTATPQLGAGTTHGEVTYASSNPSILSVNSTTGEISAQAPGTATVTATWSGEEPYCSVSSTSNVITVKGSFSVIYHANGGTGTMANQKADEDNNIAQLNANQFTRTDYAFVGWNTSSYGTGTAYTDQQTNITLAQNLILYAQWAPVVTLNDAGNEETAHPTAVNGTITLPDGANVCDPYEFVGWTSVAKADWNEGINEPTLVPSPYSPTEPTTLYAVYKIQSEGNANAFKLSFEGSNGNTYYVDEYSTSPLRGYSNISKEDAVTFIRTKMYPDDDTKYYLYMEEKGEYLYYNGYFNSTSSTPSESQGWIIHTVGDKIKLQSTYSYDPKYLYFSDRDNYAINIDVNASGSEFNMLPAVTSTYVAAPLCNQKITITFETGNGNFVDNAPDTNPRTVNQDETITLPTCEYPGYEFMGWLKDEQQPEPSDIPLTYYTGDYTVSGISSSITFYAYYKAVPEEVEFTGTDDTELLMYYYDGANYYYASSFDGEEDDLPSMQNCFNATTWTFTNIGSMQYHIQDETGKYLGAVSDNANELSLSNTPKVWNFTLVDGLWKIVCEDSPSRALAYVTTSKEFNNALLTDINRNSAYNYVALGICPYPTYTTQPVLSQGFSITNTAMVTSASGQKVKAASALTLETRNIELPCTFTIAAPNITFYDNTGAEVTELTSSTASEQFELYFAYKPTAENTIEYPTVTITDDEMKTYTIKNRIYARSLPATFAIVAKVGNLWYALPSQGLNSTDALVGYPVEVDNQNDPTAVTAVPENADWSLRQVYAASHSDAQKDRFKLNGANIMFENNASPAKMLNASSSDNYLLTNAEYDNYKQSDNQGLYEWTPTTTDLETYQLTNEQRGRTLSVNIATVFGVHAQNMATNNLRFLPITGRYTPAALQVVEWKENSIVVMYNGDPAQTASVSVNGGEAQTTTLSAAQRDIAVYELTATGLAANPTQRLSITIGTEKLLLPIPYIVNSNTTDATLTSNNKTLAAVSDLVVLNGKTFTADAATASKYTFRNVTIYGGGKLVIPSDKGFGVASLTLRAGGITDAGEYDYVYPQFELRGTFTNSAAKINYDYITDYDHWFHLVLPFAGDLGTIKYPTEFYGANVAANNTGSWQIKRYAGEIRATGNYKAWVDIETEGETSTIAGKGYIFWGAPKKVSVNGGASTRQKWGIQRITMSVTAPNAMTAENGDKAISELSSYENVPNNSGKDNDQGWNLIGNPYMVNLTDMATTGLHACKLVEVIDPATGKWNGKWKWNDEIDIRYLTIPSEHFDTYTAKTVELSVPLVPGRAFFVQLEGEANGITFAAANRASLMPALLAENNDKPVDIETGIILSNETLQDEVNFWIKDGKTNDYEYNADYPKTPNNNRFNIYGVHTNGDLSWVATSPEYAAQSMPIGYQVPAAGTFTLSVSETYYSENLQALFVTDHEASPEVTTNLVDEDYTFYVNQAETNNTRFTVSIILKPDKENTPTGVDNINTKANQPIKFLYQDKIYILRNGMIYDTTGKQVITINK